MKVHKLHNKKLYYLYLLVYEFYPVLPYLYISYQIVLRLY